MRRFILASASPRRKEILENAGYSFEIIVSDADENITEVMTPEKTVEELARRKALAVLKDNADAVIFGCDTVVAIDGKILGKPTDDEDAFNMLSMLSGRTHTVSTGVCICSADNVSVFSNTTEVEFYELSDDTIHGYIATGECSDKSGFPIWQTEKPRYYWEDKAGGYGIQDPFGMKYVKRINGDYYSVVGLPISKLCQVLRDEFNINI